MASKLPKYAQVRERLRQKIMTGEYAPGSRLPVEPQLFRALEASSTTVIRALNELTREGLLIRRRRVGTYVTDQTHPPLIPGRALKLGLLWHNSVTARAFDSLCGRVSLAAAKAWGCEGVTPEFQEDRAVSGSRCIWRQPARGLSIECVGNTRGSPTRKPDLDLVANAGFDGVVTVGIVEEDWLEKLISLGIPVVIADFPTQRLGRRADLVFADPQTGYRDAVDAFVSRGMRRIHFVGSRIRDPNTRIEDATKPNGFRFGKRVDPDSFLRMSAFRQAMDAHGLHVPEGWVHFIANDEPEWPERFATMPVDDRPEALVCHDIGMAEVLLRGCARLGLQLEAAGGNDRVHLGRARNIHLDPYAMGAVAADLLVTRLKLPSRPFLNVGVRMELLPDSGAPCSHSVYAPAQAAQT